MPGNSKRASTYATADDRISVSTTPLPTTTRLLKKYAPMCDSVQARSKFSQRQTAGSVHGLLKISASDLNELTTAQSSGNTTITPQISTKPWLVPPKTRDATVRRTVASARSPISTPLARAGSAGRSAR
ncbi:hypothetical protein [Kribbella catacumbae]|uniref:hypothetical protein n=1 Tax=Kribbella catacumbae TaxID=460086 RepID=UPI00192AB094|nr:hypothetical protein [Kribbella catacumbae]